MPRKSASKKQRGGSLASDRVMKNLDTAAATHDYVVSPRIRTKSELGNTNTYKLTGGACGACGGHKHIEGFRGCGATAPTQAGGSSYNMKEKFSNCGTKPTQSGGAHCHKKEEFGSCGGSTAPTQSGGDEKIEGKPEPPVVTQGPVTNKGYGYKTIPGISTVSRSYTGTAATTYGNGSILRVESDNNMYNI